MVHWTHDNVITTKTWSEKAERSTKSLGAQLLRNFTSRATNRGRLSIARNRRPPKTTPSATTSENVGHECRRSSRRSTGINCAICPFDSSHTQQSTTEQYLPKNRRHMECKPHH